MKTDPELCAAVARAMGAKPDPHRPPEELQFIWPDGRVFVCGGSDSISPRDRFTPDLPGTDFCKVLKWLVDEGHDPEFVLDDYDGTDRYIFRLYERGDYAGTSLDSIEKAVCRTVEALGRGD